MISIGILGFVVWSHLVALLYCKIKIINFTVGWNGWTYKDTFFSTNALYFAQSAGNWYFSSTGSSETKRENSFKLFKKSYSYYLGKEIKVDSNWLWWLIGFIEGDGAILEYKGRPRLVITQRDPKVLFEIQNVLQLGKVKHFKVKEEIKYFRYIVEDNSTILLFYLLLNEDRKSVV